MRRRTVVPRPPSDRKDLRAFRTGPASPRAWFGEHLSRMSAGYIAPVTAFSSVNAPFLPPGACWLWPTVVGTPLVVALARRYESG